MSPKRVLSLWRERWGKAADSPPEHPYLRGKLTRWGGELTHFVGWSWPGVSILTLLGCLVIGLMLMTTPFSLGGQIAFSVLFVGIALYVRRFAGTWVTLVFCGLFVAVSTRYLYWRLTATLVSDFNLGFILGFGLWVAEVYLWFMILLRIVQGIWPLTRSSVALSSERSEWPTVDVFILAQGQSDIAMKQAILGAVAFNWPKKKIKVYILDQVTRDSLHEFADTSGVVCLPAPDPCGGVSELINGALATTHGELVVVLDGTQMPDRSLLQSIVGWFMRDKTLAMLQTPHHLLAPLPSAYSVALCQTTTLPGDVTCAVFRRALLADVGGIAPEPVTAQAHTALALQAKGYGHGYIGCRMRSAAQESGLSQNLPGVAPESPSMPVLFRVDDPFLGQTLRWKLRLAALQAMMQFYGPLPRLVFWTAPLAYLLAGIQLIQTVPDLLIAYAFPYLVFTYFTQTRLLGATRLPILAAVREIALACYLFIPTTLTLVRTELRQCQGAFQVDSNAPFDRWTTWSYGFIALLNLVGVGVGITRLLPLKGQALEIGALYLLWSVCNLMLIAAWLAVAEETRHVRFQKRRLLQMPAMVQLPSGRTMTCMTKNFPQLDLSLKLPAPLAVQVGSLVQFSIFRDHHEYSFPACVTAQHDGVLSVHIEDAVQNDYRLFGAAVFSRGPDWPGWLPGRDADHPLPSWLTRPLLAVWNKLLAVALSFDMFVKWPRLRHWIGKWKKKT